MRNLHTAFLILLLVSGSGLAAQGEPGTLPRPSRNIPATSHALGDGPCAWFRPMENPDHSLDVARIITLLRFYNFRCAAMPIEAKPPQSWSDFQHLLSAAQAADIDLWAILIPPTEGSDSQPYASDYVRWFQVLAQLSLKYPHLRGANIDDMFIGFNTETFTHGYLRRIYQAKQSINPRFLFVPTLYDLDARKAKILAGCVDGVWLWWMNLDRGLGFASFLENTQAVVGDRFPVYGGVYAQGTSWHQAEPSVRAFLNSLETACRYSHGAIVWNLSLDINDPLLQIAKSYNPGGSARLAGKCGQGEGSDE
jgi:hypothetical protein